MSSKGSGKNESRPSSNLSEFETDKSKDSVNANTHSSSSEHQTSNESSNSSRAQLLPPPPRQPFYGHGARWGTGNVRGDNEEESVHYFSEPSLSEEGDSTTAERPYDRSLLSEYDEDDTAEEDEDPPPPPPAAARAAPGRNNSISSTASPGNTSLSSWESHFRPNHTNRHIRIHFSPEPASDRHQYITQHHQISHQHHAQSLQPQFLFPPQNVREEQQQQQQQRQPTQPQPRPQTVAQENQLSSTNHTNMSYSTYSMSSMDTKERKKLDDFIHKLREDSHGAVKDSGVGSPSVLNTSTEDSNASPSQIRIANLDTVLRKADSSTISLPGEATHRRISSVETELIGNTSDAHHDDTEGDQNSKRNINSPLRLDLSLLESNDGRQDPDDDKKDDEQVADDGKHEGIYESNQAGAKGGTAIHFCSNSSHDVQSHTQSNNTSSDSHHETTVNHQTMGSSNHTYTTTTTEDDDPRHIDSHNSADDEHSQFRPPRKKLAPGFAPGNGKIRPMHRRTRSGDGAAAALTTGGVDWKGMFKDKIPMPAGDDDDEDEDNAKNETRKGDSQGKRGDGNGETNASAGKKKASSFYANNDKAMFSLGASEAAAASRVAARKQRREARRNIAEKAASAARSQRIQRQYNEWAKRPLWNVHRQDSSENSTAGSMPSPSIQQRYPPHAINVGGHRGAFSSGEEARSDEEIMRPRLSLDTLSSGLTNPSFVGTNAPHNRRGSLESNHSMFSWISSSRPDSESYGQNRSIDVHPNWSPQITSLASPTFDEKARQPMQRHRRTRTAVEYGRRAYSLPAADPHVGYPAAAHYGHQRYSDPSFPAHDRTPHNQHQDMFRQFLLQQTRQQQGSSFRQRISDSSNSGIFSLQPASAAGYPPPPPLLPPTHESFELNQHTNNNSSSTGTGTSTSSHSDSSSDDEYDDDEFDERDVMQNRIYQMHPNIGLESLDSAEKSAEAELHRRGSNQHVLRGIFHGHSPFTNFGRKHADVGPKKFDRKSFLPKISLLENNNKQYPTYRCPRCQTIQREFFTVSNAPRQFETASGFLAFSFVAYVIASLYIFGLEEGWQALDCFYFAVITLTTAGLGDFVPTTDFNKIVCSIFIYFGVACIGLLLGSYIASMLDTRQANQARQNRLNSCPNCTRLQNIKDAAERRQLSLGGHLQVPSSSKSYDIHATERLGFQDRPSIYTPQHCGISLDGSDQYSNKKMKRQHDHAIASGTQTSPTDIPQPPVVSSSSSLSPAANEQSNLASIVTPVVANTSKVVLAGQDTSEGSRTKSDAKEPPTASDNPNKATSSTLLVETAAGDGSEFLHSSGRPPTTPVTTPKALTESLGSPMTKQILGRQSHTRHASFDLQGFNSLKSFNPGSATRQPGIGLTPTISEDAPFVPGTVPLGDSSSRVPNDSADSYFSGQGFSTEDSSSIVSSDSYSTDQSLEVDDEPKSKVKTAKYVFVTLKEALVNSLVIIAVGCLGFWLIEGFSLVDSWYFTTVLLTTVGYGDIVPTSQGGKLFSTIYILVAGTILLNNMSMISMIPLELRKRRIERAVLTQFGDLLDDDALRELANGPLIQRLHLSEKRPSVLNECSREMFALAMLVRLGKVTEEDILGTFHAFNRLDVSRVGVLNSGSIIHGLVHKSRSRANLAGLVNTNSASRPNRPRGPAPMYGHSSNSLLYGGIESERFTPSSNCDYGLSGRTSPVRIPNANHHTETSSLLHNDNLGGYSSTNMLSRSR